VGEGHAFISYVREDSGRVDRLERLFASAGIQVWRDTKDLWPGENWKLRIQKAITDDALVFIACFSESSVSRAKSGQNEELHVAIEQLRLRQPEDPWLIPVRFDECSIPEFEISGTQTLGSLQRVDLHGDDWEPESAKLVAQVIRILAKANQTPTAPKTSMAGPAALKEALRRPDGDIEVHDLMMALADDAHVALGDEERFPYESDRVRGSNAEAALFLAEIVGDYVRVLKPVVEGLVVGCTWGRAEHELTWRRVVERIAQARVEADGSNWLRSLHWFPILPVVYAGGLAAVWNENYGALRALTCDAKLRDHQALLPVVARSNPWRPFEDFDLTAHVLHHQASGQETSVDVAESLRTGRMSRHYTPASTFLHHCVRDAMAGSIRDPLDYDDTFDRFEVLLAAIGADVRLTSKPGEYLDRPVLGRYTWRRARFSAEPSGADETMHAEILSDGDAWAPLKAGLFGGSASRALEAIRTVVSAADDLRARQH